jgi:hypothetical protein
MLTSIPQGVSTSARLWKRTVLGSPATWLITVFL